MRRLDITGQKFGRLTAISVNHNHGHQEYWLCHCECGGTNIVRKSHLTRGRIRSCGCLYRDKKRGDSNPCEYRIEDKIAYGTDFKGNSFLFDTSDLPMVSKYNWYLNHDGYVIARIDGKNVTMHRFLMDKTELTIDHINGKKADNRRKNLRVASVSENVANCGKSMGEQPVIGIYWMKKNNKYISKITKDKVQYNLGLYSDFDDALKARLCAEKEYFGEFAPQRHLFKQYGIEEETDIA